MNKMCCGLLLLILFTGKSFANVPGLLLSSETNGRVVQDLFYTIHMLARDNGHLKKFARSIIGSDKHTTILYSAPREEWINCQYSERRYTCLVKSFMVYGDRASTAYAMYLAMRGMILHKQTVNRDVVATTTSYSYLYHHLNRKQVLECKRESAREFYECNFSSLP